jgi:diguanylate cyclase (GGDEF)-like protein
MTAIKSRITTQKVGKVLAINSDPEVLRILEVNLTHANLEVISAQNGAEALRRIDTEKPDVIILDPDLPDVDGIELCRQLKESPSTSHISTIIINSRTRRKNRTVKTGNGARHCITKPFDPKEIVALIQAHLIQKERTKNINTLTGLPNYIQVRREITGLLERQKTFAAIYIVMDGLKAFNKAYGYAQGNCSIRLLAEIVSEEVQLSGNRDDLAGYLGGDKFIVVTIPEQARTLCRKIVNDFNRRIKTLYSDEHLKRGSITYVNQSGIEEKSPVISLRIAVVTDEKHIFHRYLEVNEAATEQLDSLRHSPGGRSYFNFQTNGVEPARRTDYRYLSSEHREELRAMHGVLAWLDLLVKELNQPITTIKDCLDSVETVQIENFTAKQGNSLKTIRESVGHLVRTIEGLAQLSKVEWLTAGAIFEEVNIGNLLEWITGQVKELAEQRSIEIVVEGVENIGPLMVDRRNLTQGLLYIIRNEIQSAPPGGKLHIHTAEMNSEFIIIKINNLNHYIPQRALATLLESQPEDNPQDTLRNELYPAKLLLQGLGGKLNIESERVKGTTYVAIVPKKWQSLIQEANALQAAIEISRNEARAELRKVRNILSPLIEQVPVEIKDSLEKLGSKVQELGILCNRALFLADDLNSRLETQQDRLLQHETEQLTTLEAMLTIAAEMARSINGNIFNPGSARRVAKYALAIANEFGLSEGDRESLHHAAILKDLGLTLSTRDMVERMVAPTPKEAIAIKERFNLVWKVLTTIPFLSPALVFIQYHCERYDGAGNCFSAKGARIPLGARILAVADAFDAMTSGLSSQGTLTPKQALSKIADDSGHRFDPDVVNVLAWAWRRKELELVPISS